VFAIVLERLRQQTKTRSQYNVSQELPTSTNHFSTELHAASNYTQGVTKFAMEDATDAMLNLGRTRTVPMEVLSLGLTRCFTFSMLNAPNSLGYLHTYHLLLDSTKQSSEVRLWAKLCHAKLNDPSKLIGREAFDQILADCAAVADVPSLFHVDLIRAYPEVDCTFTAHRKTTLTSI
jgi:hypothetical protein